MTEVDSLSARAKIALKSTSFYVKYFLFIQNTKLKNPDQKGGICVLAENHYQKPCQKRHDTNRFAQIRFA